MIVEPGLLILLLYTVFVTLHKKRKEKVHLVTPHVTSGDGRSFFISSHDIIPPMQKIHFSIYIKAPREKVWSVMLSEDTYPQWTAAFNSGSYFKGSWEEGSKILFLGPNPDGTGEGGMIGRIAKNRPHEFISIEYLGMVSNGVEDTTSEDAKKWASLYENYTFTDKDGDTEVSVDMTILDEYKAMFEEMWPKGLELLKNLAER